MNLSDDEDFSLTINKGYADKYEASKRKQELSSIRDKYGDLDEDRLELIADRQHKYGYSKQADYNYGSDESSDDEEEDEHGELITPALDGQIMKTIGLIRSQDPKIYEATSHFFIPSEMEAARKQWKEKQAQEKKNKPMNLKEYHQKVLLEDGGLINEDAELKKVKDVSEMTHVEQQEYLKSEMKNAFMGGNSDDDGDDDDTFFTQKAKTKEEEDVEEEDYKRFLMESMGSNKAGASAFKDWREYKNAPQMDKDEAFLMDYILNRGWIDKTQKKTPHYKEIVREDDLDELEKSEDELDAAEEFESKYNFRFEDDQGESLITYSRTVDDSVRNKDDRRKKRRQAAKERKKEEKTKQLEDLKRAKNLKKQEIFDKLKQIQEITGNKTVGFDEIDLETEFNPEDYDQKMEDVFSNKYYEEDENVKPVFDDDIDTADYEKYDNDDSAEEASGGEDDERDNDEEAEAYHEDEAYDGYNEGKYYDENGDYYGEYGGEDENGEEDIMMDADFMPGGELYGKKETKKERARREKEEKKAAKKKGRDDGIKTAVAAIEAAKSTLDIEKGKKEFNSYLEDYYQLDYEDMVGDLPTRFKYSKVQPTSFGLTPVEILLADDKDLNEYMSLKKFAPYRRPDLQAADATKYSKKKRVQMFRHKLKTYIQQKNIDLDETWDPAERRKKNVEAQSKQEEKETGKTSKEKNKKRKASLEDTDQISKKSKSRDLDESSHKDDDDDGGDSDDTKEVKDKKKKKEKKEKKEKKNKDKRKD
ncbi:KRI1-like family C-terminal-domain-containing protein [Mortierella sp. GBAus27b]|nr:KRRI-Interacting protein 1 [Mortierella sp. GBA43]KAI8354835.1 KRI1-like family C-terminal-domain-containing protein [Mortierella sp. GBAus27b]